MFRQQFQVMSSMASHTGFGIFNNTNAGAAPPRRFRIRSHGDPDRGGAEQQHRRETPETLLEPTASAAPSNDSGNTPKAGGARWTR